MSWPIDYSDWRIFKRFEDLNAAYEIGLREAPAAIYAETSYHVEEFLKGILPALLQMCIIQAASTAIGAGIGAGLGAFVFGAGAIPGAAIGAELGFDLGIAILGWLGLAFLAVAIGHSLVDLVVLIKAAVVQAWGAADKGEARGQNVRQAGQTLARAIAILVRLILTGIVAWLTKKGIDKAPELIAELKASKLGVGFAEWVEKNLGKLVNDPKLKPHRGEGSTTKPPVESEAQSPSQLAKKPPPEEPPPPPPKPRAERLNELATDPAQGGKVTPKTMREAEVGLSLEEQGKLPSPITRDPTGASEFIDGTGQKWDVKGFNSQYAPKGYNTPAAVEKIGAEVAAGENVIVDTAKMSAEHVAELQSALDSAGLAKNVIFF